MAKVKKQQFVNGLISEYRNEAKKADKALVKKAVKESSKFDAERVSLFSKATLKKAKKNLNLC